MSEGRGDAGIIVMMTDDVFSIGSGLCLGKKRTDTADVPLKIEELSGKKIKGYFHLV